jgi:hypothetical protein
MILSILILSPWTLYSNIPYLVRLVNLSKNLYLQPSVIDTDHHASDYWRDSKFHYKFDLQQKSLSFSATPPSILALISAPSTSTPTFQHFSTNSDIGDPKFFTQPSSSFQNPKNSTIPIKLMPHPPFLAQVHKYSFQRKSPHISIYTVISVFVKPSQHQQQIMNNQHTNIHMNE